MVSKLHQCIRDVDTSYDFICNVVLEGCKNLFQGPVLVGGGVKNVGAYQILSWIQYPYKK